MTIQKPYLLVDEAFGRIGRAIFNNAWTGREAPVVAGVRAALKDDRNTIFEEDSEWRLSPEEVEQLAAQPVKPAPVSKEEEAEEEWDAARRKATVVLALNEMMADHNVRSWFRDITFYQSPDHDIGPSNWDSRNHDFWFDLVSNLGGYSAVSVEAGIRSAGYVEGEIRIDRGAFEKVFDGLFKGAARRRGRKPAEETHNREILNEFHKLETNGEVSFDHGGKKAVIRALARHFPGYSFGGIRNIIEPAYDEIKSKGQQKKTAIK